jgi:hypothetical protein
MRLPRMTTRRWTIAVAVVAALFVVPCREWHKRRVHYLQLAAMQSRMEQQFASTILFGDPRGSTATSRWEANVMTLARQHAQRLLAEDRSRNRSLPQLVYRGDIMNRAMRLALEESGRVEDPMARVRHEEKRRADYHAALRRKYERAARYPWLPVEPDPPEPK